MYKEDFYKYLAEKIGLSLNEITDLFKNELEVFNVAKILIENYEIEEEKLGKIWGNYLGFAYVNPNASIVNQEYIKKAGIDFILQNNAIPLYKFGKAVTVSTSNPQNPFIQDKIEKKLDELASVVFCFPFNIEKYLQSNNLI